MMKGYRESDISIVPEKSSNKPRIIGAEKMEERDMPEENKMQRNTCRAQDRESVHRKLQLIHQNIRMSDLVLTSEGGAVCGNTARTDLCGGCRVTCIPIATSPAWG
jgi:hypothetical protein